MADLTLDTLVDIQSMIDIMSERLVALRALRLQEFIKEEIRSLEGKLLKQFSEQLKTKSLAQDKTHLSAYQSYPSLSKWLVVVGVSNRAKVKFMERFSSVESLLSLSDKEISKFLDGLPDDKEDVRKVCLSLSLLRNFNRTKDKVYWDSWKKGPNEAVDDDNPAVVDCNENLRSATKSKASKSTNSRHHRLSTSSQSSSERKADGHRRNVSAYSVNEIKHTPSLSNAGTSNVNTASSDGSMSDGRKNSVQISSTDRSFAPIRPGKLFDQQMNNQLRSSKGKGATSSSQSSTPIPINHGPLNSSSERIVHSGRKMKKCTDGRANQAAPQNISPVLNEFPPSSTPVSNQIHNGQTRSN